MKRYTQEELVEITVAFSDDYRCGLLDILVFTQHARDPVVDVDISRLLQFYSGQNGIMRLLHTLIFAQEMPIELASHTVDLYGVMQGPFSFERAKMLTHFVIGSRRYRISPLAWFEYLTRGFSLLSDLQKEMLNILCDESAAIYEYCLGDKGARPALS